MRPDQWDALTWAFVLSWAVLVFGIVAALIRALDTDRTRRPGGGRP